MRVARSAVPKQGAAARVDIVNSINAVLVVRKRHYKWNHSADSFLWRVGLPRKVQNRMVGAAVRSLADNVALQVGTRAVESCTLVKPAPIWGYQKSGQVCTWAGAQDGVQVVVEGGEGRAG